ncbi:MFS transporter [Rhodobacter sp. Har01]|uniref:MFS transporter n=1 Tax=Rhodobacter sp. Har01 TaxID=2883999 RepID=UPI001D08F70D|nr:MFS transporter [Rhodobacter sp. Har01]MCB6179798.1 MFS transporter [Rhodobacter sp. Har01]
MRLGIACLVVGYVLSQFYRAFLAVLAPVLESDLGASKADLAAASGYWFLAFAAMQLPVGSALDRIGPRLTTAFCLMIGAGGAAVFATAGSPLSIKVAMTLIGMGCAPVLMASYYIFARQFSPAAFGTLAGITIGIGSLGNIAASAPLTAAAEAFGWRETVWALAMITAVMAVAVAVLVRDPAKVTAPEGPKGSVLTLLAMPAIWPILAMMLVCYAPPGGLRGLWLGPYFTDVWGYSRPEVGMAGLWMGIAMVIGSFAIGPMDRWLGTRKWVIFGGNAAMLGFTAALWLAPAASPVYATLMFVGLGFFGSTFPIVIAHARAFFPAHLVGRGVTLVNLFGIASVGIAQQVTGGLFSAIPAAPDPSAPYAAVFAFFALTTAVGLLLYLFSKDRTD